jgi:hypothetical protein
MVLNASGENDFKRVFLSNEYKKWHESGLRTFTDFSTLVSDFYGQFLTFTDFCWLLRNIKHLSARPENNVW